MRILQVITSLHPNGAETLVYNMIPRLRELGHDVDICLFNGMDTPLLERLRKHKEVKVYILGYSYYNPWYIVKLVQIMKDYDIIHSHNSSPQLFVAVANLITRKKLITTEHNTHNRKRNHWLLSKLDRWMYPRYSHIICISDQAEKNLRLYLNVHDESVLPNTNICTIYNGVDVEKINASQPVDRLSLGSCNKFLIVMVAGFRPQKDQDTLIRTMSKLPKDKYELWLVGEGERKGLLMELVNSLGLTENVKFLGLRMDVPNILKAANLAVMSTHYEGLSLSNIEGMAAGIPFVASDVEGIHEVTNGYGLLFPHEDSNALADIILRLSEDKDLYQQVAKRCLKRARQFDINKMVCRYNDVYMQLL